MHREQYLNNIARTAIAILAGALAGCDVYGPRPYDEQFGIPGQDAIVTAIRCSQIVCNETGVTDFVDPLGGSYAIESLTSQIESQIREELGKIEKLGGVINGIEQQYFQRVIAGDAYQWQKGFEGGEIKRVGVNIFRSDKEETMPVSVYRAAPGVEETRAREVDELKKSRDNRKVTDSLKTIKETAQLPATPENNMLPCIIEAVRCYTTVGEIADALREVWGEYRPVSVF